MDLDLELDWNPPTAPAKTCGDCGTPITQGPRQTRRYCDPCIGARQAAGQRRQRTEPISPAATTASNLAALRLRVEAAKPLLRIAVARADWSLVDAALDELEAPTPPPVIDLRAHTGALA